MRWVMWFALPRSAAIRLMGAAFAVAALMLPAAVLAFDPPLRDAQEWVEMDGFNRSVHFSVYDPSRAELREGSVDFPGTPSHYWNFFVVTTQDGIVTWWAYEMSGGVNVAREIWYAVYDPTRGEWRHGHRRYQMDALVEWSLTQPSVTAGVVAWQARQVVSGSTTGDQEVCFATYDAIIGDWQFGMRSFAASSGKWSVIMASGDGMVAWSAWAGMTTETVYTIYDPSRGEWRQGTTTVTAPSLTISDQAVRWIISGSPKLKGYNFATGAWYDGQTKPMACFHMSPSQATGPSPVWFVDMSIGATGWNWDFGDGATSTQRGTWRMPPYGIHTITQTVTGPAGTHSATATLKIGLDRARVWQYAPGPVHDGTSWETAFTTVCQGIEAAFPGGEVWVATGKYHERLTLKPGVALYGGFNGTESRIDQRDLATAVCVLNGDSAGTVVTVPADANASTVIDGFTIAFGMADWGGGIYCHSQSSPVIRNNVLEDNRCTREGGAIYCSGGAPAITNNTIRRNGAVMGGGIYCLNSSATISGNTIEGNDADAGGGISVDSGAVVISENTIAENTARGSGGGICLERARLAQVTLNIILRNTATVSGGGITCEPGSGCSVMGNVIAENAANGPDGLGGGVFCGAQDATFANNTIARCSAIANGGGFACAPVSGVTLRNNIIAFNSSGIHNSPTSAPARYRNCVYGNTAYDYSDTQPGTADMRLDPALADPEHSDYHLTRLSPCINGGSAATGLPNTDLDGDPRTLYALVDIGADEYNGPGMPLSAAKRLPGGTQVYLEDMVVVSATPFSNAFYVEREDRTCGIKVVMNYHGVTVGAKVAVIGTLYGQGNELYVNATQIIKTGTGHVEPLCMPLRSLGGGGYFYTSSFPRTGQIGVANGVGLNNIGLLVRVMGRVVATAGSSFNIDDGSGVKDVNGNPGVRVLATSQFTMPPVGSFVAVTGVCGMMGSGGYPIFFARSPQELNIIPE